MHNSPGPWFLGPLLHSTLVQRVWGHLRCLLWNNNTHHSPLLCYYGWKFKVFRLFPNARNWSTSVSFGPLLMRPGQGSRNSNFGRKKDSLSVPHWFCCLNALASDFTTFNAIPKDPFGRGRVTIFSSTYLNVFLYYEGQRKYLITPYRDCIHTFIKCKSPWFYKMINSSSEQNKLMFLWTHFFSSSKGRWHHKTHKGESEG